MRKKSKEQRVGILAAITSPLGFFVLALLITETTLGFILVKCDFEPKYKFYGLLLAVGMFVLVVLLVTLLVWFKAQNLTIDRDAHLIDRGRIPYGSEVDEVKKSELSKLPTKPSLKREDSDV